MSEQGIQKTIFQTAKKNLVETSIKTWAEETNIKNRAPRILITSVFGPYARDDEFGSRIINPMELMHNQITRMQGAYSPRYFSRSWGLLFLQANISAPSTVLDFPTIKAFKKELVSNHYDIIGISSTGLNIRKVREMCKITRLLSPHSKIIIGGHVVSIPAIENTVNADHIVKGEGISWLRRYLGEDPTASIKHPPIPGSVGFRFLGIPIPDAIRRESAAIIVSVGCPMGCNFCMTSAFFGGKGNVINFFKTTEELFNAMCDSSSALKTSKFHIVDENFLLNKKRAIELLDLMKANDKSWSLFVFASANALAQYTTEELVALGIDGVWIGLESPRSAYAKLSGADTKKLVQKLQSHGISVLGSSIIGMEYHTPLNITDEIEYAVAHNSDFHQFMLYTPGPGTPLYKEMEEKGLLLKDVDWADMHGQYKFNFKHPHISRDDSKKFLDYAFVRDFEKNGPSLFRMIRTKFNGWKLYRNSPDKRIRKRFYSELNTIKYMFAPLLWAMEQEYNKKDKEVRDKIYTLRLEIENELGFFVRIMTRFFGPILRWIVRREEERLMRGQTYEPPTLIERSSNWEK